MPGQVEAGRAFEYAVASAFSFLYPQATLVVDASLARAKDAFEKQPADEQHRMTLAAEHAALFLINSDPNLAMQQGYTIRLMPDRAGIAGDVRDILIQNGGREVGLSVKNHHRAVRHSRLSQTIDFGDQWFGIATSPDYFDEVRPIFDELRRLQNSNPKPRWAALLNKADRFYVPVLNAFMQEVTRLCENPAAPKNMVEYMLGRFDFYKIIKENGTVLIQSFNLHKNLGWGNRLKFPTRLIDSSFKSPTNKTTVHLTFDEGWQLGFRIHNASEHVEPSLKFDVQFIGFPNVSQHEINYLD